MNRFKLLLVAAGYVAVFLWAYATIVSPAFAYEGFALAWPEAGVMVWLIVLALLPAIVLPYSLSRPSALILWWLYLSTYVPSILVPPLTLTLSFQKLLPLQLALLASMGILCLARLGKVLAMGRMTLSPAVFWSAFMLIWLGGLGFVCIHGEANVLANVFSVFAGASEYSIRSEFIAGRDRALMYGIGHLGQALNPFLIAFGTACRRRIFLVAGIIGQIVIFGVTGFKTVVFSAIFLPMVLLFVRRSRRNFGVAFTSGIIAVILVCAAADRVTGDVFLSSLITRRTLAGPGLLTGFYFEHFSSVSHAGIAYHFTRDASAMEISREIGLAYFGSTDIDANANLWAEGFAELGLLGILGFSSLVAFVIWLYDSIAARANLELAVLLVAMPAVLLSNTAPTTVLVTHGGLAVALLLYLAPAAKSREEFEKAIEGLDRDSAVIGHEQEYPPSWPRRPRKSAGWFPKRGERDLRGDAATA